MEYHRAAVIGLGLKKVSDNYKQDEDIPLIPTKGSGSVAIEHTFRNYDIPISIGVGFVGAIQDYLDKGDIIVPNKSISGGTIEEMLSTNSVEGWLNHRENFSFSPDMGLYNFVLKKLIEEGYIVKVGEIFQVSGQIMESDDLIELLNKKGYLGIEMETATFFGVAQNKGYPAAAILIVSDNQWPKREEVKIPIEKFYPIARLATKILKEYLENESQRIF